MVGEQIASPPGSAPRCRPGCGRREGLLRRLHRRRPPVRCVIIGRGCDQGSQPSRILPTASPPAEATGRCSKQNSGSFYISLAPNEGFPPQTHVSRTGGTRGQGEAVGDLNKRQLDRRLAFWLGCGTFFQIVRLTPYNVTSRPSGRPLCGRARRQRGRTWPSVTSRWCGFSVRC